MPYVTTADHTQLYYKEWGWGRPVVMLHGWPLSADTFDDLGIALADAGSRAVAYDRRGFFWSLGSTRGPATTTTLWPTTFAAVIEQRPAPATRHSYGFSMGGGKITRSLTQYSRQRRRRSADLHRVGGALHAQDGRQSEWRPEAGGIIDQNIKTQAIADGPRPSFWSTRFFAQFYGIGVLSRHP